MLAPDASTAAVLSRSVAVISSVGGFGSVATMERINGVANAQAMSLAKAQGVPRFVYISAHHYTLPSFMQRGYFAGKFQAERALQDTFGREGVQIRPGFIYGTRQTSNFGLPLWLIGIPLQKLTTIGLVRSLCTVPVLGPFLSLPLTPPSSVEAVARAAVDAALSVDATMKSVIEIDDLLAGEK